MKRSTRIRLIISLLTTPMALASAALLVGYAFTVPTEQHFRLVGLALQALGLMLVLLQLIDAKKRFGQPPMVQALASWGNRLAAAVWPRKPKSHVLSAVGTARGSATASAVLVRANPSIEDRLADLEAESLRLSERINANHQTTSERFSSHERRMNDEFSSSRKKHDELNERLTVNAVGQLYLAITGVIVTLIGMGISTASIELSKLLGA